MAIAGVETPGGASLSALRNISSQNEPAPLPVEQAQSEEQANSAQGGAQPSDLFGANTASQDQGGVPGQTLDSQSLTALIQAAQEQDTALQDEPVAVTTDAPTATGVDEAEEEARQAELAAGNSTNSLAPASNAGAANTSNDTRGVSLLV
jgi:hypothetical protein